MATPNIKEILSLNDEILIIFSYVLNYLFNYVCYFIRVN